MNKFDKKLQKAIELHRSGRFSEAIEIFKKVLPLDKSNPQLLFFLGSAYARVGQFNVAVEYLSKSLAINPNNIYAINNLGIALRELKKFVEALERFDQLIGLAPDFPNAFINRANVLKEMRRFDQSLVNYEKALSLNPNASEAFYNIGTILGEIKKFKEAIINFDKAILIDPDNPEYYYNRGIVLSEMRLYAESLQNFDRAIELKSDYVEAYNYRGSVLRNQGRYDEAIISFSNAIKFMKDYDSATADLLYSCRMICDWDLIDKYSEAIETIGLSKSSISPFTLLSLDEDPSRQKLRSIVYANQNIVEKSCSLSLTEREHSDRISIGYFSADFHDHATMHLLIGILEHHDRKKFKLNAYSFGPITNDKMQCRVIDIFDNFRELHNVSDDEISAIARGDNIDIAVDLKGYTKDSRPGIFASRVAPIQINYLGYPGTMGAGFMDYIIADKIIIPSEMQVHYSEKVIYLPHCYQPNDNQKEISTHVYSRKDEGLPENSFIYCCFNNNYKISRDEFCIWMNLLRNVENSVLWLLKDNSWAEKNLKVSANKFGISPDRIIFANRMSLPEHLARQKLADLFLDTFNYNAHTTASDALWVGLPVLTKLGRGFPSRVSASLLTAIGVPELITATSTDYENKAIELATSKDRLHELRNTIAKNRGVMPLFDTRKYTQYLENSYEQVYARWINGYAADVIYIDE